MAEKKGVKKKIMKNKGKFARIRANMEREKSNLKKVLKSSGVEAAKAYAARPDAPLYSYLERLLNKRKESARPNRNAHKARRPASQRTKS